MQHSSGYELMGYLPYQFYREFNGKWTPFNQSESGHVGILNLFKITQKQINQPYSSHEAACQGIALLYIDKNCSMQGLSIGNPEKSSINVRAMVNAVENQIKFGGTEEARDALVDPSGRIKCKKISIDSYPMQMDIDKIFERIYKACKNTNGQANVFFMTGYCEGEIDGEPPQKFEAAHAFVISYNGKWSFFEAMRGEVAFEKLEELVGWIKKESKEGVLKELASHYPTTVREGVKRHYFNYTLDVYHKDLPNQNALMSSIDSAEHLFKEKKDVHARHFFFEKPQRPMTDEKSATEIISSATQKDPLAQLAVDVDKRLKEKFPLVKEENKGTFNFAAEICFDEIKNENPAYQDFTFSQYLNQRQEIKERKPKEDQIPPTTSFT